MSNRKQKSVVVFILAAWIVTALFQTGCSDDDSSSSDSDTDGDTDGDSDSDGDSDFEDDNFDISVSFSTEISTVAIVEWSTTYSPIESADIEFGRDESYGMTAPVDLDEPNFKTLLLGMKASSNYHFRIAASDGSDTYHSNDFTITTGAVPNGMPTFSINTPQSSALHGGFVTTVMFMDCNTFILDEDGDYVWWYFPNMDSCSRARMSYDGKHMLIRNVNVGGPGGGIPSDGKIIKVSMDGLETETFNLSDSHHDFTVLPDGSVGYIDYDGDNCDDIMEIDSNGTTKQIFHLSNAVTPENQDDGCHTNAINYWPEDDTYTVSLLILNLILKVTRSGSLVWIFGGDENEYSGSKLSWTHQHGHHLYDGKIVFFNNDGIGDPSANVLFYSLDEDNLEASLIDTYTPGNASMTLGDVQHLSSGNTLVTFSSDGVIHEIDSDGDLVQSIFFGMGGGLGYAMKRDTLYGPPPK